MQLQNRAYQELFTVYFSFWVYGQVICACKTQDSLDGSGIYCYTNLQTCL